MRIIIGLLFSSFSFLTFGQEKPSFNIEWESFNNKLSENIAMYTIEHQEITPCLSYLKPKISTGNYQLMEINLAIDLRKQQIKDNKPILLLPENKFIQSNYSVAVPAIEKSNFSVTITGNGGYNSNNPNNGGVKNTVYEDASRRSGIYCPVTGLPLTIQR